MICIWHHVNRTTGCERKHPERAVELCCGTSHGHISWMGPTLAHSDGLKSFIKDEIRETAFCWAKRCQLAGHSSKGACPSDESVRNSSLSTEQNSPILRLITARKTWNIFSIMVSYVWFVQQVVALQFMSRDVSQTTQKGIKWKRIAAGGLRSWLELTARVSIWQTARGVWLNPVWLLTIMSLYSLLQDLSN